MATSVVTKTLSFRGMRLGDFLSLIQEARKEVPLHYWPQLARGMVQGLFVELMAREEEQRLSARIAQQCPVAPVVILGCMRSGTTNLHFLLGQDQRFACPTTLQVLFPHNFFFLEGRLRGPRIWLLSKVYRAWLKLAFRTPRKEWESRGHDNVPGGMEYPNEDSIAMMMMKLDSEIGHFFPSLFEKYGKFLTLRELSVERQARWENQWMHYLKKLTLRHSGKRLLLKSPGHTGKVRTILKLFPEAKFVHILRNPYDVFRSFRRYYEFLYRTHEQYTIITEPRPSPLERFLEFYRELFSAYLEDRELIPAGHLHELKHEELIAAPMSEVERIYQALAFPGLSECRLAMERYVAQTADYKPTNHAPLEKRELEVINRELGAYIEILGYPLTAD